ncbi:MAG: demethoxyubiquinone hydroxylase family protein [Bacteroidia bacterium]|nr:demethoxyubiquinone hydroxylase family protein [Bacteroidia bacterium]
MSNDLEKRTIYFIKDLHARESMRLGWYRQWGFTEDKVKYLRERKAKHEAFLKDLLRKRGISPAWYARFFYLTGHFFGLVSAFFPEKLVARIERTLEFWILLRYKDYFREMNLDQDLRTMIESLQLKKLQHNEPGKDVLTLLERIIAEEEQMGALRQS